jgi:iron(III) transport system substrate-binding protein
VQLGGLSRKGLLRTLPIDLVREVPPSFAGAEPRLDWVGLTGRARALVYDPAATRPESLPRSLEGLGDPAHRGRLALAPGGGALQAQMAAFRVLRGEEALDALLARVHANEPRLYASDADAVAAVAAGEAAWGLVDHVAIAAAGGTAGGRLGVLVMPGDDGGSFVDAAGIAVLSDDPRALELVRFLLGEEAQAGLAERTGEYPLARGTPPRQGLPPLDEIRTPRLDYADVAAVLDETGRALRRHGLGG